MEETISGLCGSFDSGVGNQHQAASDKFWRELANTDILVVRFFTLGGNERECEGNMSDRMRRSH